LGIAAFSAKSKGKKVNLMYKCGNKEKWWRGKWVCLSDLGNVKLW